MLELIGFCAIAYLVFKFAPAILDAGFKFSVIVIGFFFFILLLGWFTAVFQTLWT